MSVRLLPGRGRRDAQGRDIPPPDNPKGRAAGRNMNPAKVWIGAKGILRKGVSMGEKLEMMPFTWYFFCY